MLIHDLLNIHEGNHIFDAFNGRPQLHRHTANKLKDIFSVDQIDYLLTVVGLRQPFFALSNNKLGYTQFHDVQFQERLLGICNPGIIMSEYLQNGSTLIVKHLHYLSARVNELVNMMINDIYPYTVQCNAYLAPPSTQGVAEHADPHHTLLIQLSGSKRWLVWDKVDQFGHLPQLNNPVHAAEAHKISSQSSPLIDQIVEPGDVLFIPRGYVHTPYTSDQHSLHITLGIQENSILTLAQRNKQPEFSQRLKVARESVNNNDIHAVINPFVNII